MFTDALIHILDDRTHPLRRIAQWCVLDMFEDLPAFCRSPEDEVKAVAGIRDLVWSANDDYARTIYKAGVVLGGHVCSEQSAEALLACMFAPSRVGRRSAMHAVFHLAEWMPEKRDEIVGKLKMASKNDSEPLLRTFAACMARDIESKAPEHVTELDVPRGGGLMIAAVIFAAVASLPELEDVLVQDKLKGVIPGVCVLDAQGELIYERGGFSRVIPASNQKIMTAAYVLHELGPDAVIETRFWKTDDGVIVDAPGDPTITLDELLAVREELEIQDRAKV